MKLSKQTRKRLYEAKKPIWISWPADAPDPHPGRTYRVAMKEQRSFGILIEGTKERGTKALVKIHDDPVQYLPGLKGIRNAAGDYESEPEPVDAEFLSFLAIRGYQKTVLHGSIRRPIERKADLERELLVARSGNRGGRTRKLEAQLSQHERRMQLAA